MIDTHLPLLKDLFSYPEFRVLFGFLQALLWVLLLLIVVMVVLHVAYLLGYQSPLYRKRSPKLRWSRQFFAVSLLTSATILAVIVASNWLLDFAVID